jgi:hypothetical protein
MQSTVEQVSDQVQMLSVKDLRKVRKLVDSLLVKKEEAKPTMTEEEFVQHLYEKGIIGKPPPPITDFSHYDNYKPVTVTGEPISEMIIRERR